MITIHFTELITGGRKKCIVTLEAVGGMCVWTNMSGFSEMNKNNFTYCLLGKL